MNNFFPKLDDVQFDATIKRTFKPARYRGNTTLTTRTKKEDEKDHLDKLREALDYYLKTMSSQPPHY